jgi:hypothetical protein
MTPLSRRRATSRCGPRSGRAAPTAARPPEPHWWAWNQLHALGDEAVPFLRRTRAGADRKLGDQIDALLAQIESRPKAVR